LLRVFELAVVQVADLETETDGYATGRPGWTARVLRTT